MKTENAGFTLVETAVVVVILLILGAIAIPAYTSQVMKSRRAEAQSWMVAVQARQQQFLLDTRAYATSLAVVGIPTPANVDTAYAQALTVSNVAPPTFTLTLTPRATQVRDSCGTLTIDQAGTRTAATASCW